MPEELALEELARQRRAVHGDERPGAVRRLGVEGARDDLLPGPALPGDQNRGVAPVERLDEMDDPHHRKRPRDEAVRRDRALQHGVVVLGGPEHDEVPRPRIARAHHVLGDGGRRDRDEPGRILAAPQDAPPPFLAPPFPERLAKRVLRPEQARADQRLDRLAYHSRGRSFARERVERVARADDHELRVERDEDAAQRFEDRLEVGPAGNGNVAGAARHGAILRDGLARLISPARAARPRDGVARPRSGHGTRSRARLELRRGRARGGSSRTCAPSSLSCAARPVR